MIASGICHTDLLVAAGDLPDGRCPTIVGHEGAGRVVSCPSGRFQPGQLVLLSYGTCVACPACTAGDHYACDQFNEINFFKQRQNGTTTVGTLADGPLQGAKVDGSFFGQSSFGAHALVRVSSCVGVPEGTDMTTLAPLGCGMQTGAGGVFNAAKLQPGHTILISGRGGVGMAALFAVVSVKPKTIVVTDLNAARLALAKELGAHAVVNPADVASVPDEVRRLTGGRGVDYAIEATGHSAAASAAFMALARRGRLVQIGASPGELSVGFNAILDGLRSIEACVEGNDSPTRLVPRLAEMYRDGKVSDRGTRGWRAAV